eukprot:TRINITY_DN480_c0_g9_i1.p1 TRINITY_DN480_c0_g9~~TRINITY_DN480_c0_g9_i1.p1  ORF type:complete len:675 (-),score=103.70 TRINITY_DN480_c0_g9_i1:62-2086(-)
MAAPPPPPLPPLRKAGAAAPPPPWPASTDAAPSQPKSAPVPTAGGLPRSLPPLPVPGRQPTWPNSDGQDGLAAAPPAAPALRTAPPPPPASGKPFAGAELPPPPPATPPGGAPAASLGAAAAATPSGSSQGGSSPGITSPGARSPASPTSRTLGAAPSAAPAPPAAPVPKAVPELVAAPAPSAQKPPAPPEPPSRSVLGAGVRSLLGGSSAVSPQTPATDSDSSLGFGNLPSRPSPIKEGEVWEDSDGKDTGAPEDTEGSVAKEDAEGETDGPGGVRRRALQASGLTGVAAVFLLMAIALPWWTGQWVRNVRCVDPRRIPLFHVDTTLWQTHKTATCTMNATLIPGTDELEKGSDGVPSTWMLCSGENTRVRGCSLVVAARAFSILALLASILACVTTISIAIVEKHTTMLFMFGDAVTVATLLFTVISIFCGASVNAAEFLHEHNAGILWEADPERQYLGGGGFVCLVFAGLLAGAGPIGRQVQQLRLCDELRVFVSSSAVSPMEEGQEDSADEARATETQGADWSAPNSGAMPPGWPGAEAATGLPPWSQQQQPQQPHQAQQAPGMYGWPQQQQQQQHQLALAALAAGPWPPPGAMPRAHGAPGPMPPPPMTSPAPMYPGMQMAGSIPFAPPSYGQPFPPAPFPGAFGPPTYPPPYTGAPQPGLLALPPPPI